MSETAMLASNRGNIRFSIESLKHFKQLKTAFNLTRGKWVVRWIICPVEVGKYTTTVSVRLLEAVCETSTVIGFRRKNRRKNRFQFLYILR